MAPLDSYTIQLKNLHKRYKLSQSILNLFRALDDHRSGSDPEALGRLMRMSPGKRKACTDTIAQLARVMQKKQEPSTVAECTEIIQNCAELLALANEPGPEKRLPLMKLPPEVRKCIYSHYINSLFSDQRPNRVIISKKAVIGCHCLPFESKKAAPVIRLQLALTSKTVKDELLAAWFDGQIFHFTCGCELKEHISKNPSLRANLRRIKINWTGPQSAVGFKLLKQVSTLRTLVIIISKSTTNNLSERERQLQKYFTHKGLPRLTDALGFDELLELRSLSDVQVDHAEKAQAHRRTNEERHNLEDILQDVIKR